MGLVRAGLISSLYRLAAVWEVAQDEARHEEEKQRSRASSYGDRGPRAAGICGVSNTAIDKPVRRGSVTLLKHALRLSRASGILIEEFVGDEEEAA